MLIDYRELKSAGVYTFEVDNTQMPKVQTSALRLLIGFNPTGAFNVPVFVANDRDRRALFGDIDPKTEEKGAFLNRSIKTALQAGPVFALNLLPVDSTDKTNYTALSLDSSVANPSQSSSASGKDVKMLPSSYYRNQNEGDFIGVASFPDLYERSKFWNPSPEALLKHFRSTDQQVGSISDVNERKPLLGFANTSTKDISILVFKPGNLTGYDVTVREWYGGEESIPYKWIRPTDYISDYFIQVVAIQGLWSDFRSYSADPYWSEYFTNRGVKYDKLREFMSTNSITQVGSWIGCIIPDFVDQTGASDYIINKINNSSTITGLTAVLNTDALGALEVNLENNGAPGTAKKVFTNPDFCATSLDDLGDAAAPFQVDLVGHNLTDNSADNATAKKSINFLSYNVETDYVKNTGVGTTGPSALAAGSAELHNVKYFGNYNTVIVPPQKSVSVDTLRSTSIDSTYKKTLTESMSVHSDTESTMLNGDYLNDVNPKSNSVADKIAALKEFTANRLGSYINAAITASYKAASNTDNIKADLAKNEAGRSYNAFNDISETAFLHNMSSGAQHTEADSDLEAVNDMARKTLIPGLTHISNIQTVDLEGLVRLNSSNTTAKLTPAEIEAYAAFGPGATFKIVNCVDPILLTKDDSKEVYYAAPTKSEKINKIIDDLLVAALFPSEDDTSKFAVVKPVDGGDEPLTAPETLTNGTKKLSASDKEIIAGVIKAALVKILKDADGSLAKNLIASEDVAKSIEAIKIANGIKLEKPAPADDSDTVKLKATFQYPLNSSETSGVLRFIPLRGLELKPKHLPGFDSAGCRNAEAGVEKIYSMLTDHGIYRGLTNPDMINFRYIVDTMAGGLRPSMGGKVYLSRLAKDRGKCTALLNAPSIKSFTSSTNPYFCDTYNQGLEPKPAFDSKYVPMGGNKKMVASNSFSLMSEGDGATFAGVFAPYLKYSDGHKTVMVPPAADVSNTFMRKFNGGDPYAIVANTKGVISGADVEGVEVMLDKYDRDQFEPFGLNSIIQRNNQIMIYSNRTPYQRVRSDFNFLHVRELLNTIEIEIEALLQNFVFEYNNAITRGAIMTLVNPVLSTMRDAGALHSYELSFNETPDDSALIGDEVAVLSVGVVVNKGMEKIVQVISVNKRGKIKLVR